MIFIKTIKVGGTSFEIALSKYCDENDIVTPITRQDEIIRSNLGYQGPINYNHKSRSKILENLGVTGNFRNHISAEEIQKKLGHEIFSKSKKISIHRKPLDFIVSLYWFQKKFDGKYFKFSFRDWLEFSYKSILDNYKIAPINGPHSPDIILEYENLVDDIKKVSELPSDFLETFSSLRAKGNFRPTGTEDSAKFFKDNNCEDFIPKIIELSDAAKLSHNLK